jgi:NAD(P)-dependent dehydrogenase (short-subunit alcohol dehydrogenase family)
MDLGLRGRTALVSGSTAGIGQAIAAALAAEGARVAVNGRSAPRVEAAIASIRRSTPAAELVPLPHDLATAEGAAAALCELPELDVLVNNLGIYEPKAFAEISDAEWARMIEVNFMSGVRLARHYLPRMMKAGWGRVVFVSSESAVNIPPEMIHYGVTKTMQVALARGLAETTAGTGVTVNSVLAGPTRSEGVETFIAEVARSRGIAAEEVERDFFATMRPTSLLRRFAATEEVAAMVAYVASARASATNGAALRVDGGVVRSIL